MIDNSSIRHERDLGCLAELVDAVREEKLDKMTQARSCAGIRKRLFSEEMTAKAPTKGRRAPWRLAVVALGAVAVLFIVVNFLQGGPRLSFARVISNMLQSPFHAVWERYDEEGRAEKRAELFYDDGVFVSFQEGRLAYYHQNGETWHLDRETPMVLPESPESYLSRRAHLMNPDTQLDLLTANDSVQMDKKRSTLDGRPVTVWRVISEHDSIPWGEYVIDDETGRLLQLRVYGEESKMAGKLVIQYGEDFDESVFDVELPDRETILDLKRIQGEFESSKTIALLNEPGIEADLRNLLVGPDGELIGCLTARSTESRPPIVSIYLRDAEVPMYFGSTMSIQMQGGLTRTWLCFVPQDPDSHLERARRAEELVEETFEAVVIYNKKSTYLDVQPQGKFSEDEYTEKVYLPMLASGSQSSPADEYSELREKTAQWMAWHTMQYRAPSVPFEQWFARWLERYRELALQAGHEAEFQKALERSRDALKRNRNSWQDPDATDRMLEVINEIKTRSR